MRASIAAVIDCIIFVFWKQIPHINFLTSKWFFLSLGIALEKQKKPKKYSITFITSIKKEPEVKFARGHR